METQIIRIGSLFSGCGGLDLGIEAALAPYAKTVWQVEKDPYCQTILKKNFDARIYGDVRTVGAANLEPVHLLIGGFPCTEVSWSNNAWGDPQKTGLAGENSGLWRDMYRVICEVQPTGGVVIENVPALAARGLGTVIGDLMALSRPYRHIEWDCISAQSVGARHRRDRIFIIAHNAPDTLCQRLEGQQLSSRTKAQHATVSDTRWGEAESRVDRSTDGVPNRVHRVKALGNAVVPQVAYQVGLRLRGLFGIGNPPGGDSPLSNDPL